VGIGIEDHLMKENILFEPDEMKEKSEKKEEKCNEKKKEVRT